MKRESMMNYHAHVIDHLRRLPRKMLNVHGMDNVTEFVLHELSGKNCFNLPKAAYFIDNPDFNCFKGIAGVSHKETHAIDDIWQSPDLFTQQMRISPFNNRVRAVLVESHKRNNIPYEKLAETIANDLDLNDYQFYSWDMKHNNHGLLVCEKDTKEDQEDLSDDTIIDGLCLLGFCPVH